MHALFYELVCLVSRGLLGRDLWDEQTRVPLDHQISELMEFSVSPHDVNVANAVPALNPVNRMPASA